MQAFLKGGKITSEKPTANTSQNETVYAKKARKKPPAPWVEKYRPRSVEDVVEQAEVVAVLKECLNGTDLPNMLLYGPPGTGKTSTILAAARQLFGDMYKDRILELNASDERGINVVRTKIKDFAQLAAGAVRPDGKPCPPFKIIILDEADSMTTPAQAALRRTMEKECKSTRFCLVCNYVSRIIEPITSRCTKFRFKPLGEDKLMERLRHICEQENVKIDDSAIRKLMEISEGDLRRAINLLQSCYRLKGFSSKIEESDLFEISGAVPDKYVSTFMDVCKSGNYSKLEEFVQDLTYEAYSVGQMLGQLNEYVLRDKDLNNKQKSIICERIGEAAARLEDGCSEYLQIMDLGCTAIIALRN